MSQQIEKLRAEYGPLLGDLKTALDAGDGALFLSILDDVVHRRERALFSELRKLTGDLQSALERFRVDSRLVDLAEKEVPDARHRLDHVLKMTDEAAHRTMDLVERSAPLAGQAAAEAESIEERWKLFRDRKIAVHEFRQLLERMDVFLPAVRGDMEAVRSNLNEVLLAQGYQDLSGQIIRGVMTLVGEIEIALGDLVRLSSDPSAQSEKPPERNRTGYGPAVPGVDHGNAVGGQQDVDSLLAGLGM
jgi:chemotaxis protein CheZ